MIAAPDVVDGSAAPRGQHNVPKDVLGLPLGVWARPPLRVLLDEVVRQSLDGVGRHFRRRLRRGGFGRSLERRRVLPAATS